MVYDFFLYQEVVVKSLASYFGILYATKACRMCGTP